jgi:hypothetical protein
MVFMTLMIGCSDGTQNVSNETLTYQVTNGDVLSLIAISCTPTLLTFVCLIIKYVGEKKILEEKNDQIEKLKLKNRLIRKELKLERSSKQRLFKRRFSQKRPLKGSFLKNRSKSTIKKKIFITKFL